MARRELVDGARVPWDFVLRQKTIDPQPSQLPPPVRRTPQQQTRRRLIAGGIWRRP